MGRIDQRSSIGSSSAQRSAVTNALTTIESVTDEAFTAQVDEVKGDIFSAQGNFDKARIAYSSALEKNINNRLLQMKLDNLAVNAG